MCVCACVCVCACMRVCAIVSMRIMIMGQPEVICAITNDIHAAAGVWSGIP